MSFLSRIFSKQKTTNDKEKPKQETISVSMAVALKFAQAIEFDEVEHDLNPYGFSHVTTQVNGVYIRVKWWRDHKLDRIEIGGDAFIGTTDEADILLKAALKRSKTLLTEKLEDLSNRVLPVVDISPKARSRAEGQKGNGLTRN